MPWNNLDNTANLEREKNQANLKKESVMTKHAAKLFIRFYFGQMSCALPTATSLFICELPREKVEHFVPSLNYS